MLVMKTSKDLGDDAFQRSKSLISSIIDCNSLGWAKTGGHASEAHAPQLGIYSSAIACGMFIDDIERGKKTCMLLIMVL